MAHRNILHLSQVSQEPLPGPEGTCFGGFRQRVGAALGAAKLGYGVFAVPAGKTSFPYHVHGVNEEMIYILEGEGTLRFADDTIPVTAGTFIACPAGWEHPHQLVNTSDRELRYLVVSTMEYPEFVEYPDSKKIGVYAGSSTSSEKPFRALYLKDTSVPYYQGETGSEVERIKKSKRKTSG